MERHDVRGVHGRISAMAHGPGPQFGYVIKSCLVFGISSSLTSREDTGTVCNWQECNRASGADGLHPHRQGARRECPPSRSALAMAWPTWRPRGLNGATTTGGSDRRGRPDCCAQWAGARSLLKSSWRVGPELPDAWDPERVSDPGRSGEDGDVLWCSDPDIVLEPAGGKCGLRFSVGSVGLLGRGAMAGLPTHPLTISNWNVVFHGTEFRGMPDVDCACGVEMVRRRGGVPGVPDRVRSPRRVREAFETLPGPRVRGKP